MLNRQIFEYYEKEVVPEIQYIFHRLIQIDGKWAIEQADKKNKQPLTLTEVKDMCKEDKKFICHWEISSNFELILRLMPTNILDVMVWHKVTKQIIARGSAIWVEKGDYPVGHFQFVKFEFIISYEDILNLKS